MNFGDNFEQLLNAFNKHHVNYMLVGGYAVNYHGFERTTSDLDVWVQPSNENKKAVIEALKELGYGQDALKMVEEIDFCQAFIFRLAAVPDDVEIFNFITGVKYEEAEPHKIRFTYPGQPPVYFISLKDLIINKMISGRPQDKFDVDELQRINALKKD